MSKGERQRLFFALNPDERVRAEIAARLLHLPDTLARWIPAENLHITLLFLGEVSSNVRQAVEEGTLTIALPDFWLTMDQVEYRARQEMIWLSSSRSPIILHELVNELSRYSAAQGIKVEKRDFKAHITLARKARNKPSNLLLAPIIWKVTSFSLMESVLGPGGASYMILRNYPLLETRAN